MNSVKSTIINNIILVEKDAWTVKQCYGYTFTKNKYSKSDFEECYKRGRSEKDISEFEEDVDNAIMRCQTKLGKEL